MATPCSKRGGVISNNTVRFRYDYLGRRVQKYSALGSTETWTRYLYDGDNPVAEFAASGNETTSCGSLVRSYTWGLDLTGSTEATGGVGALLQISDHQTSISYYPTYDGNGNVVALLNSANGAVVARYEYSPFRELLRCEGSYAKSNPVRFSTKFVDDETGLIYYGLRYYSPGLGRFINRDPIEEAGGLNLYGFCANDGVNGVDVLGMGEPGADGPLNEPPKDPGDIFKIPGDTVPWVFFPHLNPEPTSIIFADDASVPRVADNSVLKSQVDNGARNIRILAVSTPTASGALRQRVMRSDSVGPNSADLIGKIANNIHTLQGIANRLPADQREKLLRQIWGGTTGTTTYTGLLGDFTEGSYRLAKLGLDAAGERALRKSLTSLYKGAASTLKVAGAIGTAVDVTQLFVDIGDRDGLSFVQHSAGVASSLTSKVNPAIGMAVSGFRYMWDDQSTRALDDISMMDKTSIAEANTRQNINIQNGLRNIQTWMGQLQNGP